MAKRKDTENDIILQRKKQRAFLTAYATCGVISRAAEAAGIARQTHYDWMNNDPEYVEAFKQAEEEAAESLEAEARRRALEGWEEPVYYKGRVVGSVRKYSDTLLMFMLKGAKPEKYKERAEVKHEGEISVRKLEDFL
jgi:hypothetical protein